MRQTLFEKYYKMNPEWLDTSKWPRVLEEVLSEKDRLVYTKRKKAIDLYISREVTTDEIFSQTGIARRELASFFKRCMQFDENQQLQGYRALIPNRTIKSYTRSSEVNGVTVTDSSNLSGSFTKLLREYPELEKWLIDYYLRKSKDNLEPVIKVKFLHKEFLKTCKAMGIDSEKGDYPFNTKDLAYRSLYRYIGDFKKKNPSKIIGDYGNDAKTQFHSTGIGDKQEIISRPFQRVEFDGHKIDALVSIKFITPDGDIIVRELSRIWLLAIIDVATGVVLGYHVCTNTEYSQVDVLQCIENAIKPWTRRNFVIDGLEYPEKGGFPSEIIPETKYAVWDEIAFDNAKANLAKQVEKTLTEKLNCSINIGPPGTPTRRPNIEKFFHLLESNGFQRLVSTTGNNPKDPRRKNPESKAVKYEISIEEIEDLIEVLIYEHNGKPSSGNSYIPRIEVMKQRLEKAINPRKVEPTITFSTFITKRKVLGSMELGKRPYINYEGVKYKSQILSQNYDLTGITLTLEVDTNDLRNIKSYLPDGSEFGLLTANGKWGVKKHSLRDRKTINSLSNKREIFINEFNDPIDTYHKYLVKKAEKNKSSRNKLATLRRKSQIVQADGQNPLKSVDKTDHQDELDTVQVERKPLTVEQKKKRANRVVFNR